MLKKLLNDYPRILAECAVAERLRRTPGIALHPTLYNTPLIYGPEAAREAMAGIYREYLEVAQRNGRPLLLTAPTWRVDPSRVAATGVPAAIVTDAVKFLMEVRGEIPAGQLPVAIGGLVGPRNDCYKPELAPLEDEAERFHATQIEELTGAGVDYLLAQTMPSVREAVGIARAMARTGRDYLISFCTGPDGLVLDGTPLPEAMARVDASVPEDEKPVGYFVNCTHPGFLLARYRSGALGRLIGIQANGSSKDVTRLDGASATVMDPVEGWASAMLRLHEEHQVAILGGCCGTTAEHMQAVAV